MYGVAIHAVIIGVDPVFAVAALVHQLLSLSVFLWVQEIVAVGAKP
jgi:hypothetical protein